MAAPPDYLKPLLHSIESTVLVVNEEFPQLSDKEVEFGYDQLKQYFRQKAKSKKVEEPLSTSGRKQVLMDEILNILEEREELKGDDHLIMNKNFNPDGRPIPSLSALYTRAFNILIHSLRYWRKNSTKGYLKFLKESL